MKEIRSIRLHIRASSREARGFTLVELLVVVGIIALLIGILLPVLSRVQAAAKTTACMSNLRQIGAAYRMYANDNRDHYPSSATIGMWGFRRRPGLANDADPGSYPEWIGLIAVFHGIRLTDYNLGMPRSSVRESLNRQLAGHGRYLDAKSDVWICPTRYEPFVQWGATYAYNINDTQSKWTSAQRSRAKYQNVLQAWDNSNLQPYQPGAMAPLSVGSAYTINPVVYPHNGARGGRPRARNELYFDGRVETVTP